MDEVVLEWVVYRESTGFPVKIALDAKVSALQDVIAGILSTAQHSVPPRHLKLYVMDKNDESLKHDEIVESCLRCAIHKKYMQTCSFRKLTKKEVLGSEFVLGEGSIQFLVELPPQQQTTTTSEMARDNGKCENKKSSDVKNSHCDASWGASMQRMEVCDLNYSGVAINGQTMWHFMLV